MSSLSRVGGQIRSQLLTMEVKNTFLVNAIVIVRQERVGLLKKAINSHVNAALSVDTETVLSLRKLVFDNQPNF